jgi:hypothetical protein
LRHSGGDLALHLFQHWSDPAVHHARPDDPDRHEGGKAKEGAAEPTGAAEPRGDTDAERDGEREDGEVQGELAVGGEEGARSYAADDRNARLSRTRRRAWL